MLQRALSVNSGGGTENKDSTCIFIVDYQNSQSASKIGFVSPSRDTTKISYGFIYYSSAYNLDTPIGTIAKSASNWNTVFTAKTKCKVVSSDSSVQELNSGENISIYIPSTPIGIIGMDE